MLRFGAQKRVFASSIDQAVCPVDGGWNSIGLALKSIVAVADNGD
jgi:hypothetical protein